MSTQNLILVVALLASSSILTVAAMPSLPDSSAVLINSDILLDRANPLHNLTLGQRVTGDKLSGTYSVDVPASPWHVLMMYKDFKVATGQRITLVQVTNLEQRPDTSIVVHIVGGPGLPGVGLLFGSKIDAPIHFAVRIYSI